MHECILFTFCFEKTNSMPSIRMIHHNVCLRVSMRVSMRVFFQIYQQIHIFVSFILYF